MGERQITLVESGQLISEPDVKSLISALFENLDISPSSRYDYEQRTPLFLSFIKKTGLTRNCYLDYKRYLASRVDYCVSTKVKYLTVAKVILKELNRQGYLPTDITSTIKGFQQSRKHKKDGINDEEMARLMANINDLPEHTPETTKLKAILSLLILQGLRQVEISRLDVSDLDLGAGTAMVLGKGRDDKEMVDLHPETTKALASYLTVSGVRSGALFISHSNNSRNQRLSTRSIRVLIKSLLTKLEINRTVHGFRHYFVTTLIKTYHGDLLEVAGYTRHKSLEMLQVYNDKVKKKSDLPRYYAAFSEVGFSG